MHRNQASHEQMDRVTTRSICHAVGERLRQHMRPETSQLPPSLQALLDELRRQERNTTH